ncbi:MAG: ribosome recycling factor, partial [Alphaproteobacteria bacterium]|nr:ribosome recycling factor [Alphaproteobacteria bacterium]
MKSSLEVLRGELSGLRSGRASPHMLDAIMVEAYGQRVPLQQCG